MFGSSIGNQYARLIAVIVVLVVCFVGFVGSFPNSGASVSSSLDNLIVAEPTTTGLSTSTYLAEDPSKTLLAPFGDAYQSDPQSTGAGARYWLGPTFNDSVPTVIVELIQLPSAGVAAQTLDALVSRLNAPVMLPGDVSLAPQGSPTTAAGLPNSSEWEESMSTASGDVVGPASTVTFSQGAFVVRVFLQDTDGDGVTTAEQIAHQELQLLSSSSPVVAGNSGSGAIAGFFVVLLVGCIVVFLVGRKRPTRPAPLGTTNWGNGQ